MRNRDVRHVVIYGYSHGGGSTHDLASRLTRRRRRIGNFDIPLTAYIDAIRQLTVLTEVRRPPGSLFNMNFLQEATDEPFLLDGTTILDAQVDDFELNLDARGETIDHFDIDESSLVLPPIFDQITRRVER